MTLQIITATTNTLIQGNKRSSQSMSLHPLPAIPRVSRWGVLRLRLSGTISHESHQNDRRTTIAHRMLVRRPPEKAPTWYPTRHTKKNRRDGEDSRAQNMSCIATKTQPITTFENIRSVRNRVRRTSSCCRRSASWVALKAVRPGIASSDPPPAPFEAVLRTVLQGPKAAVERGRARHGMRQCG